ncbi:hypothetical protein [Micromonospora sp. DPT]|uniref:hypothetical protein n=1 Tax=Micromonospora sp. DPT TaxID=3142975 RepID=UPI003208F342
MAKHPADLVDDDGGVGIGVGVHAADDFELVICHGGVVLSLQVTNRGSTHRRTDGQHGGGTSCTGSC